MILTNKQKKALEKMADFLNNNFDIFLLKGYAIYVLYFFIF